jgi:hypothetical protein
LPASLMISSMGKIGLQVGYPWISVPGVPGLRYCRLASTRQLQLVFLKDLLTWRLGIFFRKWAKLRSLKIR